MPLTLPRVQDATTDRALQLIAQQLNPPVPQARVYNSANISIPNNAVTALTFDSERWDNGDLHSTPTNTGRLTAPIAGLYDIGACVQWASPGAPAGERLLQIRLNGVTALTAVQVIDAAGAEIQAVSTQYRLAATDYVEVVVFQNSGGALNVSTVSANSPEFWMARLAGFTADTLG